MQDDQNELMLKAKNLLNAYSREEFGSDCDFADLTKIAIGYTTISDEELPFQAYANLIDHYIELQIDGECVERVNYESLKSFVENGLKGLSFDDLIHLAHCLLESRRKMCRTTYLRRKQIRLRASIFLQRMARSGTEPSIFRRRNS